MGTVMNFLLCSYVVVIAQGELSLKAGRRVLMVDISGPAELECCYTRTPPKSVNSFWIKHGGTGNKSQKINETSGRLVSKQHVEHNDKWCGTLTFRQVQLTDTGLYQCVLNDSSLILKTDGTYLKVYVPLKKTINLSESTKNKILTAEGVLLLLCVLLPAATLLCQSKKLNELEKKKVKKEEENIYQGLNLDDCVSTYDQIERSQTHGPYEDVCNIMEEEEEIQLEKP